MQDISTADAAIYQWHVVIQEPVRIKDLKYLAEKMIQEAQTGPSFSALEILIYDYPEYIGYGYTLARIVFAPQGNLRLANTVRAGDYEQMSIQWDVREKIWENRLSQEQVEIWKAWQDCYEEESRKGTILDQDSIDEIVAANMDSVPMVCFTGQVASPLIGKDAFQEADITGITMPITKHNYVLERTEDLPRIVKEAFHIASTNRPGPVVIDLPKDLMEKEIEYQPYPHEINLRGYRVMKGCNYGQVVSATELINKAERPVIYAGGGVVSGEASEELRELAVKRKIPVTTTLMGMSAFPGSNYLSLGMLGMHGTRYANYAIGECDLLIAIGVRFDDRVTGKIAEFAPHARIIHIDIDAAEIGKNVDVHIPIVGQVKEVLQAINKRLDPVEEYSEWHKIIDRWKAKYPLRYGRSGEGRIMPQHVVEKISELTQWSNHTNFIRGCHGDGQGLSFPIA
jgi:CO dehydrogenase/acetyl-CoA synthase epsilon subunit